MSKVIKGGTIVTADRTYKADVLIEGEKIAGIGPNLKGDETVDATDAYVIPGVRSGDPGAAPVRGQPATGSRRRAGLHAPGCRSPDRLERRGHSLSGVGLAPGAPGAGCIAA